MLFLLAAFGVISLAAIVVAVVAMRSGTSRTSNTASASNDSTAPNKPSDHSSNDKCSLGSLKCDQFSTKGRVGVKLHELVYEARMKGRYNEAICLARNNSGASDGWLAGASHFEASNAWESLGCHDLAVAEVEASLQVRPHGRSGWKETCDWCAKIRGKCGACSAATAPVACPGNAKLVEVISSTMVSRAPSGTTWGEPSVELCTPIALPHPGWYVVGNVHQEIPDRTFRFHVAVDAQAQKVVAASDGEQHSIHEACEVKLVGVQDQAGAPSTVSTREDCVDKTGRVSSNSYAATIAPPRVIVH